jgi:hypothetical protein
MKKIIPIIALLGVLGCSSMANAGVRVAIGIGVGSCYGGPYPYGCSPGAVVYVGPGYYGWHHGYRHGGYVHRGYYHH